MAPPRFYVLAGPNGSGKTSFALNDPALRTIPFINADIEAQQLSPGSPAKAALAAGRVTLAKISREISEGRDFALETTLSGLSTLETMRRAMSAGYVIDCARVFDNSEPGVPKLLLETRDRSIVLLRQALPDWFKTSFRIDNAVDDANRHVERLLDEHRHHRR